MSRLRTPSVIVGAALNVRTEGLGIRATGRSFGKSHSTILRWEQRLAQQTTQWSSPAPDGSDVTLEGDEVYTRVGEPSPPKPVNVGQSISSNARVARQSHYWITGQAGQKQTQLVEQGTQRSWN